MHARFAVLDDVLEEGPDAVKYSQDIPSLRLFHDGGGRLRHRLVFAAAGLVESRHVGSGCPPLVRMTITMVGRHNGLGYPDPGFLELSLVSECLHLRIVEDVVLPHCQKVRCVFK